MSRFLRLFSLRGLTARIGANLLVFVLFGVAVTIAAMLSYAGGVFLDDSYRVSVPLEEAGGVLPLQEVTVLGDAVGQVETVEVTREGVLLTLKIAGDERVPAETDIRVLRRSPIGEQAVDFTPLSDGWVAAEPGDTIIPRQATTPSSVPFLLEQTVELFEAIDTNDLNTVLAELAIALEGREDQLKRLNRDTIDLNQTIIAGIPEFERLLDTSETVLATLDEHASDLTALFTNGADLAETLSANRPVFDALLDSAPRALTETQALLINTRANLQCIMNDVTALNNMLLGPSTAEGAPAALYDSKLDEFNSMLVLHRQFFQMGFSIIPQPDPLSGVGWTRVAFVLDGEETGQEYPEKRPTPPVLPGAACQTEQWGTGVNAVRQADPSEPDPTSPGILYAPLVDPVGPGPVTPEDLGLVGGTPAVGAPSGGVVPSSPLPVTGGGVGGLAVLATLLAVHGTRRRRTR